MVKRRIILKTCLSGSLHLLVVKVNGINEKLEKYQIQTVHLGKNRDPFHDRASKPKTQRSGVGRVRKQERETFKRAYQLWQ